MAYDHDCLTAVSISRERVKKKMRGFLGQLQSSIKDNNSSSVSEKIEKDDFKIVVFSNENNKKNNKMNDDWIIDVL
ncbi:uncharacterized protein CIMG_13454 [Coccidioides immitis RS]|uniref:Uncharacterized protein n=1 Tax=Coccidioides immitis (strain RS) TaxID=246410 RepID=A0A0D8JV16_COCIM|nr:uncharacterized protein CIMG_13454 [Coccidioides immitis RS]KJF61137.1 hypothetical protein CIMG_13454 [Coccidioides immitis RS]